MVDNSVSFQCCPRLYKRKLCSSCMTIRHQATSGTNNTLIDVREKFYWVGCSQAIENWCRHCHLCATRKGPHKRKIGPAQIYLSGAPMERVAIDILGPLPETDQANRYLLVAVDYFTKWPGVYPLPNQVYLRLERLTLLERLKLFSLEEQRLRGDLIQIFKLLSGKQNVDHEILLNHSTTHLRGHS